jgi:pyruvate kinase
MVTLPSMAADDFGMVKKMIEQGMNCARINCAHDDKAAWAKMIDHVRKASQKLKNESNVMMDLAGPKIRTGPLWPGPKVRKFRPQKDERGRIIQPLAVLMGDSPADNDAYLHIPVTTEDLEKLKVGVNLYFRDARDKKRTLIITQKHANGFLASCPKTTYLETGIELFFDKGLEGKSIQVGDLPNIEIPLLLQKGDTLKIDREPVPGGGITYDEAGQLVSEAHISCTTPEVFDDTKEGEPILFDDGKIGGIIKSIHEGYVLAEITHAAENGGKLRADKGINFPVSELTMGGLTEKDKADLEFVAKNTDVINLSFVNGPEDVTELLHELTRLEAKEGIGLILKIETQRGFNHLTEILLEAMQMYPVGVMIARGDLAVESGWKNIGRVQDEILSICQAAHVTDIWATQVLESLAKKGLPSRAEITDVVKAQQADCVMLNKGPYILESIKLLDSILKDMEPYREKNISFSPALSKADLE